MPAAQPTPTPPSGTRTLPVLSSRPWAVRIAVGFLLPCLIWLLVKAVAAAFFGPEHSLASHAFRAVSTCVLVFGALAVVLRWERTRPSDYAVAGGRGMLWGLALGAVSYLVPFLLAASVVLGVNLATLEVAPDPLAVAGQGIIVLALVILYEAVPEELIFRGYLFRVLAEHFPAWLTILAQALMFCAFGVIVGAAVTLDRVLLFFVFALSLGYLRQLTGTVFATIGFHAVFQMVAQWSLGEQWVTVTVSDPAGWFSLVTLGLVPFAAAPSLAALINRWRASGESSRR